MFMAKYRYWHHPSVHSSLNTERDAAAMEIADAGDAGDPAAAAACPGQDELGWPGPARRR